MLKLQKISYILQQSVFWKTINMPETVTRKVTHRFSIANIINIQTNKNLLLNILTQPSSPLEAKIVPVIFQQTLQTKEL